MHAKIRTGVVEQSFTLRDWGWRALSQRLSRGPFQTSGAWRWARVVASSGAAGSSVIWMMGRSEGPLWPRRGGGQKSPHQAYGSLGLRPEAELWPRRERLLGVPGAHTCLGLGRGAGSCLRRWFSPPPTPLGLEASFRNCRIRGRCSAPQVRAPEESVLSCPSPVLFSLPDEGSGKAFSSRTFLSPRCCLRPFLHRGSVLARRGV